jgi:5-methylcytosine-specific restriction protein B
MNNQKINIALNQYLTEFDSHWDDERYKWVALQWFQKNWDIDAPDFADMLKRSLAKTSNLLTSYNNFPRGMILNFAKVAPEDVRKMFRNLFDESIDLIERYNSFIAESDRLQKEYNDGTWKQHYQKTNAVSTYLWLMYPEKYYIFKYSEYKCVSEKLELDEHFVRNGSPEEMIKGFGFYDSIGSKLKKDDRFINLFKDKLNGDDKLHSDPELHTAIFDFGFWVSRFFEADSTATQQKTRYWLYAPGTNASMWDECQDQEMMCVGWAEVGDLSKFKSKKEITEALQKEYNRPNSSCMNDSLALWQFVHDIKPGDIVYAKKGTGQIVGRGVVAGDYEYIPGTEFPNIRKVNWTHSGVWKHPGKAALKTLTDISSFKDYVKELENVIVHDDVTKSDTQYAATQNATDGNAKEKYWWLVANPKIWSMSGLPVGGTVEYSLYNDNGKQRRIFQNLLDAKVGDLVIGYESTPRKQIVALAEVSRANDGKTIEFKKTESLQTPIDYASIKDIEELANMQFFGNAQGSFFTLTEDEYDCLYDIIRDSNPIQSKVESPAYTQKDFLDEVYMTSAEYGKLIKLLTAKKNIILQGAPGVGKTFSAKRLAYAMMGTKDNSRIEMVQFHQNYTYEDFIMGYKPNEDGGFRLQNGKFYNFCNAAKARPDEKFFFIIDEINRGNLSKIFGELLMLIENSYRGSDNKIELTYSQELFYVPNNLYIIGMMNTADRSLAMIDYALRRRFSFYDMTPGFDTEGFKAYQSGLNSEVFDNFIEGIKRLNEVIAKDDSLGAGFCIGHSYFCGQKSFDKDWLNNVLEFDIAPMLKEYWFDDVQKYESQVASLKSILK